MSAKKEFQAKNSSRMPEANRPSTAPPPATPTQTPTARPRSSGGKVVVMIDKVTGMTAAAPIPITARSAIRDCGEDTNIAAAAALPKITSPASSTRLRPNRSPSAPAGRRSPTKTRV